MAPGSRPAVGAALGALLGRCGPWEEGPALPQVLSVHQGADCTRAKDVRAKSPRFRVGGGRTTTKEIKTSSEGPTVQGEGGADDDHENKDIRAKGPPFREGGGGLTTTTKINISERRVLGSGWGVSERRRRQIVCLSISGSYQKKIICPKTLPSPGVTRFLKSR